jgi:hypothetical protein
MWRKPGGTGSLSIKRIIVECLGNDAGALPVYGSGRKQEQQKPEQRECYNVPQISKEQEIKTLRRQHAKEIEVLCDRHTKQFEVSRNQQVKKLQELRSQHSCEIAKLQEEYAQMLDITQEQVQSAHENIQAMYQQIEIEQHNRYKYELQVLRETQAEELQRLCSEQERVFAEKRVAIEKAAVEKAAAEKVAAEKAAVEKAAVEKAAVEKAARLLDVGRLADALDTCTKLSNKNWEGTKVLFLHYSTEELNQVGITEALEDNGFNVCSFCFNQCYGSFGVGITQEALVSVTKTFQPDWILMQLQFFDWIVAPDTISKMANACPNACIVNTSVDIRHIAMPYFVEIGKRIYKSLIPATGQLQMYRDAGCTNVDFWQQGYDPKYFFRFGDDDREKLHRKFKNSISFCANRNTKANFPGTELRERVAIKLHASFGTDFALYGQNWANLRLKSSYKRSMPFYAQNGVYNGSKVVISVNHFNDLERYVSNRQFIAMATGTVTVSSYIPGFEEYFTHGKDSLWFKTTDECVDLCTYCLQNPEEADKIGREGAKKMVAGHTYYHRVRELAKRLGFEPVKK